jgi:hypothetical protein
MDYQVFFFNLVFNFVNGRLVSDLPQRPGSSKQEWWLETVMRGTFLGLLSKTEDIMCLLCILVLFNHSETE